MGVGTSDGFWTELTNRETQVLQFMREGITSAKGIAHAMGVSVGTVRNYRSNIYEKFALKIPGDTETKVIRAISIGIAKSLIEGYEPKTEGIKPSRIER